MPLHCQKFQNSKTIEFCGNPVNWIPVYKREQGAMYNRSIVTKDKRETEECAHGVFSEVKNTVTGKTRKDRRRRSGYAGRQSVMPGIVFDVMLPKWLVSTLSWLSVHVRLPTYSNSARYMSSQHYFEEEDGLINFSKIIERIDQLKFCYVSRVIQFYTFFDRKTILRYCIAYKCNDHASSILWKKHWKWYYKIK